MAVGGFEAFVKKTRRSVFLATMNRLLPWAERLAVIDPYYAKVPYQLGNSALAFFLYG